MTQPTPYERTTNFAADEAANVGGRSTVRTAELDAELDAVATTLAGVLSSIALNQRDDGEIRDMRVKLHTLAPDVRALLASSGATIRGNWMASTMYSMRDIVAQGGSTYMAATPHTSGVTFTADLAAGKWLLLATNAATAGLVSDLASTGSGKGADMVAFKRTAVGAVAHSLALLALGEEVSAWEFFTDAQIASIQAYAFDFDASVGLQLFVAACANRKGFIPAGGYRMDERLLIDPVNGASIRGAGFSSDSDTVGTVLKWSTAMNHGGIEWIYAYAQYAPGGGADAHTSADTAGGLTALGNPDNLNQLADMKIVGPGLTAATTTKAVQLYAAGTQMEATGNGIFAYWAGNTTFRNLWVSNWPGSGLRGWWCFGTTLDDGYYVGNRDAGIYLTDTNNLVTLHRVKAIGNGQRSGAFANWNCCINSTGPYPNLGVNVEACDFESAGFSTLPGYSFPEARIVSVSVSGGVATVTFDSAPAFAVGHYIGVWGGTSFSGNADLNTKYPAVVATKVGNAITFPTTSTVTGTRSKVGLHIGPYSGGLCLDAVYGGSVKAYAESTVGPAVSISTSCRSVAVRGGHFNNSAVFVDAYKQGYSIGAAVSAGSGYLVGDILTPVGGTVAVGGAAATLRVTAIGAGGSISAMEYASTGRYYSISNGNFTFTGGSGSGAQFALTFTFVYPAGVDVRANQFSGAGGGVYSISELGVTVGSNAYVKTGSEQPALYLGQDVAAIAPTLVEMDTDISQGTSLSRGVATNYGVPVPAHISNLFAGIGTGQKLVDDANSGTGRQNTAYGVEAGYSLTTGYSNLFAGYRAGASSTSGQLGVFLGNRAGQDLVAPVGVVAIGGNAMRGVTLSQNTVAIGIAAGSADSGGVSDGGSNVIIGANAGRRLSGATGAWTQCVLVGDAPTFWSGSGVINYVGLGSDTMQFAASNRVQIGNGFISSARVQVAWTIVSDRRVKTDIAPLTLGLQFVRSLQPVSYRRIGSEDQGRELGFIAQEVDAALKAAGAADTGVVPYDETADRYGLRTQDLIAALTKAVQELAAEVDALKAAAAAH